MTFPWTQRKRRDALLALSGVRPADAGTYRRAYRFHRVRYEGVPWGFVANFVSIVWIWAIGRSASLPKSFHGPDERVRGLYLCAGRLSRYEFYQSPYLYKYHCGFLCCRDASDLSKRTRPWRLRFWRTP